MTETKSEIVIVGAAAAFLAWLWLRNRAAGAGTGIEGLPTLSDTAGAVAAGAPGFSIPAPVPGLDVSYVAAPFALPAPPQFSTPSGMPQSCDCGQTQGQASTFGSNADLTAWLATQPAVANAVGAANNWY